MEAVTNRTRILVNLIKRGDMRNVVGKSPNRARGHISPHGRQVNDRKYFRGLKIK
jgi:hypothetical protein